MSLLIKGIEMPKRHLFEAFVAIGDGQIVVKDLEKNKLFEGKIEEIPTPHGRLIDADELLETIEKNSYFLRGVFNSTEKGMFLTGIRQAVGEAPTIIEAENSSAIDDDVKKYCDYLKSETYDFCNRIENGEVNEG